MMPNTATSRRSRVSRTFTTASPRSMAASCRASNPMLCSRNCVSCAGRWGSAAWSARNRVSIRLRLDQGIDREVREEFRAERPPKASLRLIGEAAGPLQAAGCGRRDFVRQGRARPVIEQLYHLGGELGALHQDADLGVLFERARIEVERADENGCAVEHERLAVQARPGGADRNPGPARSVRACRLRP